MAQGSLDVESGAELKKSKKVPNISYFTLYKFASKCDIILITISLLATIVIGIMVPIAIMTLAATFQNMVSYQISVQNGKQNSEEFLQSMHKFGVKYSSIGFVMFIGGYLGGALMNLTAIKQVYKIRKSYLTAALNQDLAFYDLEQSGDFASRMSEDLIKVEDGIGDKVAILVFNIVVSLGCFVMAMFKGWKLALLCLTAAPITFLLVGVTGRIASRISKKVTMASGRASAVAQEVISSIRTVYAFNGQAKALERYRKPLVEVRKYNIKKDLFTGLSMGFLLFCIFCSYALSFYLGVYLIINDPLNYNADVMFSVFIGVVTGMGNLGAIGSLASTFGAAKGAGAKIFYIINNKPTINPLLDIGLKPTSGEGNIDFKNVVFHYPSRPEVPVLKGISIEVKRGQSVAFVGHSGSGKSTIVHLLLRFYDVVGGSIHFNGHDIRELSVSWLRSRIGLVGQQPVLFSTTIHENILHGRSTATDDEVVTAAKMANAHQFIKTLPKGYFTLVGEGGASLSGGQKQRIAIARALIRKPMILLLDEATSALDNSSEAKLQAALKVGAASRITIVVAHRLSTIRDVDVIYVMDKGVIVESGSHEQLMASKGHYYKMVILQEPNIEAPKNVGEPRKVSAFEYKETVHFDEKTEVEKERKDIKMSLWRVVALNRPEWKSITCGILSSTLSGFSLPLFVIVFGNLFGSMSSPDPSTMMAKTTDVTIMCSCLGVVTGIATFVEIVSFGLAGAYLTQRLRERMFEHLLRQQISYYDDQANSTGALCARLSSEAAYVQSATGQRIGILMQGVSAVSVAIIIAMIYEWRVGLMALSFLPLVVFIVYYETKIANAESNRSLTTLENSTKIAVDAVSNIETVAALGREKKIVAEYMAEIDNTMSLSRRLAHYRGLVNGLSRSIYVIMNSAALTFGGHLIVSDGIAYENVLVAVQGLQMASNQAQNAFTFTPDFQKGIVAAGRIESLLKTKPTITDLEVPSVIGYKSKGEASLKDVEFSYPTRRKVKVLRGLNLKIESGKTIALVGHSGCGKSTVIQLLQRYYDPDAGTVFLDNYPIPHLRISEVRQVFGLVSQEPVLFDCSIRENIAYGDNSRVVSDKEVFEAAKQANIHTFIVSLPKGYDTNIGSKGVQLSGGQKQRLAIARALIRDPKILLLDEATSALDSESEKVVVEALNNARSGRTCVVVAHRLSTICDAHSIGVINNGLIAELGTHEQLLQQNGMYATLYNTCI